jgi:hypothetical protein
VGSKTNRAQVWTNRDTTKDLLNEERGQRMDVLGLTGTSSVGRKHFFSLLASEAFEKRNHSTVWKMLVVAHIAESWEALAKITRSTPFPSIDRELFLSTLNIIKPPSLLLFHPPFAH